MDTTFEPITHILVATLLAMKLFGIGLGVKSRHRFRRELAADPGRRRRFYRDFLVSSWLMTAYVPMIAYMSPDLSAADLGWAWPSGDGLDYLLASYLLVIIGVGALRLRRRMRRGHTSAVRAGTALIVPRTAGERWLAVAVSITAGITEEAVYRGVFIAAGTRLYHLPLALAAAISLALFVAAHAYQGRRGMLGIAVLGTIFTGIYLVSGSLLLVIIVHVCQDLVALLLIPAYARAPGTANRTNAESAAAETNAGSAETDARSAAAETDAESAAEVAGHDQAEAVPTTGPDQAEPVPTSDAVPAQPVAPPALRPAVPG